MYFLLRLRIVRCRRDLVIAHLLSARGVIVNFAFAAVAPCVAIVVGRRVLGRKNL